MKYSQFNCREYETHKLIFDLIPRNTYVLDLGCASGYFSKELLKKSCVIDGVDSDIRYLKEARKYCRNTFLCDFENIKECTLPTRQYDVILLMDVLEHIKNRSILSEIHKLVRSEGEFVLSTPNIAHISVRMNLLFGKLRYTKTGILDESHVHFYTKETLIEELESSNWQIQSITTSSDFGQIPVIGRFARHIPKRIQAIITGLFPTLFGVQWIVVCKQS